MNSKKHLLNLRDLKLSDAEMVFRWRNDPYIVSLSSLKKTVTWNEHLQWFTDTVAGTKRKAYILEIDDVPAGQVRFDFTSPTDCTISVYLLHEFTGKGHGVEFIDLGCKTIFSTYKDIKKIYAFVRTDNPVGQKGFLKAGFTEDRSVKEKDHVVFARTRR